MCSIFWKKNFIGGNAVPDAPQDTVGHPADSACCKVSVPMTWGHFMPASNPPSDIKAKTNTTREVYLLPISTLEADDALYLGARALAGPIGKNSR